MRNNTKGLVISTRGNTYMSTFRYVQEAETRLGERCTERASELITSAYAALEQALHVKSHPRKSTLYLAARMAAGLSMRELASGDGAPEAA